MLIDRVIMASSKILAQCAGFGLNFSVMSTGDSTASPPDGQGTLTDQTISSSGC